MQKKCKRVEFSFQHTAKTLSDLPGLLIQRDPKATKIEVLKKVIKVFDREHGVERFKTAYITDPKQIKQFKKRKSKKEVREAKRKGGPAKKKRTAEPSYYSEEPSIDDSRPGKMIIKIQQSTFAPSVEEEKSPAVSEPEEPV